MIAENPTRRIQTEAGDEGGPVLVLEGVSARLGSREILHQVDLTVEAGTFMGLIGSNGAGKTTLLRVILGLVPPSAGRITFGGPTGSRRHFRIGYVPQTITLDADMPLRARDVVALGLDGHRFGIRLPSTQRGRLVDEMLEAVGASRLGRSRIGDLSGGEQQRVLIAHALIGNPSLLLLDEPLANLDIRSEQEVVALVARVAKERNIPVMISTHDMNALLPVMDRVAYVAKGRVASGTVEEVVTTQALSRLYGHHVDVIRVHDRVLVVAGRMDMPMEHDETAPVTWTV
jgi:zinc/manganese transport system ATP-binding protein